MTKKASDPIPETMRVPPEVREKLRIIVENSHENPRLRADPVRLLREALSIGIESKRLAG